MALSKILTSVVKSKGDACILMVYLLLKWFQQPEFRIWTRLFAFPIVLMPMGKIWFKLFFFQPWENSWANWALYPWYGNCSRRKTWRGMGFTRLFLLMTCYTRSVSMTKPTYRTSEVSKINISCICFLYILYCQYIYIYIQTHTHTHTHTHTNIYIYVYIHMFIHNFVFTM